MEALGQGYGRANDRMVGSLQGVTPIAPKSTMLTQHVSRLASSVTCARLLLDQLETLASRLYGHPNNDGPALSGSDNAAPLPGPILHAAEFLAAETHRALEQAHSLVAKLLAEVV